MTDERDDRLFQRAAASLRSPGARDGDALVDALSALQRDAGEVVDDPGDDAMVLGVVRGGRVQ
jgi:hypothetical protein